MLRAAESVYIYNIVSSVGGLTFEFVAQRFVFSVGWHQRKLLRQDLQTFRDGGARGVGRDGGRGQFALRMRGDPAARLQSADPARIERDGDLDKVAVAQASA